MRFHARRAQRFQLFTAATEHERIAALQPYDAFSRTRFGDQHVVDLLLRH